MKVAIGAIIRNRAWVLPDYLDALSKMRMGGDRQYLFLENDSTDETAFLLDKWGANHSARVVHINTGVERWEHHQYDYANLANLRNLLLEWFLTTDADFFMSVDSDIIVRADTFEKLHVAHERTGGIVGAAICNVAGGSLDGHTPGNFMVFENGALRHPVSYPLMGELEVDLTGAAYLIPRWVVEQGARYANHPQGEDVPFCESAKALRCTMHVNMDAKCEHRMVRG